MVSLGRDPAVVFDRQAAGRLRLAPSEYGRLVCRSAGGGGSLQHRSAMCAPFTGWCPVASPCGLLCGPALACVQDWWHVLHAHTALPALGSG